MTPASADPAEDTGPRAFACTFDQGTSWSYSNSAYKTSAPATLSFGISDINLDQQTAKLITDDNKVSPGTLRIVRAVNANHFLEVVNEGFLNLTTIYDKDPSTGNYPAVHSRHLGVLGQPVFAQYAGFCTAK
jgi:hypothetical protein